jgi:SAM-dependent methyltransferase
MVDRIRKRMLWYYGYLVGNGGYCPLCEKKVRFVVRDKWLRDNYLCSVCHSIPRYRALIDAVKRFYPNFADLQIHESSPNSGSSSAFLRTRCRNYSASQYYEDVPRGQYKDVFRSEDLSSLTFADESFDLLVTQDVFEHVMEPQKAFAEIARVLRPGGAHIFSMPWYPKNKHTIQRAKMENGVITHLHEPVYHGNPINRAKGSLVTFDWGQDFVDIIKRASGLSTIVYLQRDRDKGIDGEFLEIFISQKTMPATL